MKAIKIFSLLLFTSALMWSCKKEETRASVAGSPKAGTLTASTTTPTVAQATAANDAVTFTFTPADFGFPAELNYTLQFDKKTGNFSSASEILVTKSGTKTVKQGELNTQAVAVGMVPGTMDTMLVRVKYDVKTTAVPAVYSNIVKIVFTPYFDIVVYDFPKALRIAGNYQGWDPGTAPSIVDKNASGTTGTNYEGYIYFNDPSPQFKMVKGNNWGAGDFGMASATTLSNGGSNLTLSGGAGVYRLRANTSAMTWSNDKITTWGIVGDATPGGWGGSTAMTFVTPPAGSPGNVKWTITTNLTVGEMKFRANDAWAINFGDNSPRDNKPEYDGGNIPIAVAGNYTITLDLLAGNYNYTIKKN
jgi:starch-binding outer membrane protein SusE/F